MLGDEAWFSVLLEGALSGSGMANFSDVLDRQSASDIRDYLIRKAHDRKKEAPVDAPKNADHSS
jgi:hypothetical protein